MKKPIANLILIGLVFGLVLSGCDNSFNPVDFENGLYSVYGVFQAQKEPNFIRVRDLNVPFTLEATENIDAQVILENLDTDASQTLNSIRTLTEETYIHNFVASNIKHDTNYRVEVKRSDGRFLEFTAKTPKVITTSVSPQVRDCKTEITIEFENTIDGGNIQLVVWEVPVDNDTSTPGIDITSSDYIKNFYVLGAPVNTIKPNSNNISAPLEYKFRPIEYNPLDIPDECSGMSIDRLFVSYIYFSEGLQEELAEERFDPLRSSTKFGAIYVDTLIIPFETSIPDKIIYD